MVGGAAGIVCGLLLIGASILTSTGARRPIAPPISEFVLIVVTFGAVFGAIVGAFADVNRPAAHLQGANLERGEGRGKDAHAASPAISAAEMLWKEMFWGVEAPNKTNKPTAGGLSIRLVPDPTHDDTWAVAFRNDGPATLSDVKLLVFEGGIPTPGDLGSTIGWGRTLDHFGPSDEFRFGSFRFVLGGDYLGLPLSACLLSKGHNLLTLYVTTDDLDRLGSLPAVETPPPEATE